MPAVRSNEFASDEKRGYTNRALVMDEDMDRICPSKCPTNSITTSTSPATITTIIVEEQSANNKGVYINDVDYVFDAGLKSDKIMADSPATIVNSIRRESVMKLKTTWQAFKGIFLAFVSSFFFSVTAVIVKYLKDVHPGEMACFRFMGILLFSIPIVSSCGENIFGPRHLRLYVILRGLAGASSLYLRYNALQYIPIANATVIVLSMPIFVCIFARVFLKEAFGLFHVIALTVTLVGIAFTSKLDIIFGSTDKEARDNGFDRRKELFGLLSSMGATLVGSTVYIFVRKVKCLHHSVILFNFAWVAILETSVITYSLDGFTLPDCGLAPWLLVTLAVLSFYGQLLLTKALQAEEAGLVSVTRSAAEVVFAFLFQILVFRELPDNYSVIGAVLVTSAVLLTSIRKWISTLKPEHWARQFFAFTLK